MDKAIIPYYNTLIPWVFDWRLRNKTEAEKLYQIFLRQDHEEINLGYICQWIDNYHKMEIDNLSLDMENKLNIYPFQSNIDLDQLAKDIEKLLYKKN